MMPLIGNFNDLFDQWRKLTSETLSELFEWSEIDESALVGKSDSTPSSGQFGQMSIKTFFALNIQPGVHTDVNSLHHVLDDSVQHYVQVT